MFSFHILSFYMEPSQRGLRGILHSRVWMFGEIATVHYVLNTFKSFVVHKKNVFFYTEK